MEGFLTRGISWEVFELYRSFAGLFCGDVIAGYAEGMLTLMLA